MPASTIYELIGYAASFLVAVSLMMSSILKLRIINLVGAFLFSLYGLLIHAYPVAAMNFFIVIIDLYYLYEIFSTREFFHPVEIRPESEYLQTFLSHYAADIRRFQPDFSFTPSPNLLIIYILRNVIPAGLIIGEVHDGKDLYIQLDYAIPGYRDLRTAKYVFQGSQTVLRSKGIRQVFSRPGSDSHNKYLKKMGFSYEAAENKELLYCLHLD
jgi:hypothetical protein